MKYIYTTLILATVLLSCKKDTGTFPAEPVPTPIPVLTLNSETSPFSLTSTDAKFYKDISYGDESRNVFDFFKPHESTPSSLCIFIHGGGFVGGDKTDAYSNSYYTGLINNLLADNIAVATVNYSFIQIGNTTGVLKSMNDSKRALQFMRYYSNSLNFDKVKVVLMGSSAGAGTSLWIGFNDEMAETSSFDKVLRESTRVQGIVSTSTQADYDILEWHSNIFSPYNSSGFNYNSVKTILSEYAIFGFYGVSSTTELNSAATTTYRNKVSMLKLMSSDDPEFYALNISVANVKPTDKNELFHHGLHVKAMQDKATSTSTTGVFYAPQLGIDTRGGESIEAFVKRKIGN